MESCPKCTRVECRMRVDVGYARLDGSHSVGRKMHCDNDGQMSPVWKNVQCVGGSVECDFSLCLQRRIVLLLRKW
jgi:hypothetical protein